MPTSAPLVSAPAATLVGRRPDVGADRLIADLVPPPRFDRVRFSSYVPNPAEPSQTAARDRLQAFAATVGAVAPKKSGGLFKRKAPVPGAIGVYLDGGFGVGKTHLLASLWHESPAPREKKAYGTFVEYTSLVGALGFAAAVERLADFALVCIDEFELDDPGDTVLVSTLLTRLSDRGVKLAATSNTLPDKLGEGRFAAADFLREIQALSARFEVLRVDGPDYRHRDLPTPPSPVSEDAVTRTVDELSGATLDTFDGLTGELAAVHPSRYGALIDGVSAVGLTGVRPLDDQNVALRLVVLIDRLYDRKVPVIASGTPLGDLFTPELLRGGYRKKYLRAISRITALARDGVALAAAEQAGVGASA
ncbi:AFG1-family ATPase [Catenulispora acidiphila DSM 44928]|uniref:AFG1-family ATPase n=1 Tax=Catenulispora acidiphila (strain DSM 44928 / JCM 14897 / NBRC 102108 / NRRL B-24433 / ID139908) TaxID=479433 RepID=C7Q9P5_CATAD|nr:cell division protein ZapE [Catenulispora acidiphila]ACU76214.1 AFG1-family ATPase [Catenulispora acidiphila DSM 44928]